MNANLKHPPFTYESIFWSEDWAHIRFYGWQSEFDATGLRVLRKKAGPLTRNLVLMSEQGRTSCVQWLENCRGKSLRQITLHDFSSDKVAEFRLGGISFSPCDGSQRMLNIATSVIDLAPDSDTILAAMSSDYRRKIRKAESGGVDVSATTQPTDELRKEFVNCFNEFAEDRRIQGVKDSILEQMYLRGSAVLLVATLSDGSKNFLHLYLANHIGFFMHGVSTSKLNDGAGPYLHWKGLLWLKEHGMHWYDLGGLPNLDPQNGLVRFKRGFGGQVVNLGCESRFTGNIFALALAARRSLVSPRE
jgi:hypothetical protein